MLINTGGVGAVVMPAGSTPTGTVPANTSYGLVATTESSIDFSTYSDFYHAGVLGLTSAGGFNSYGVFGSGGYAGVFGSSSNFGVQGSGFRGVVGTTNNSTGAGVFGDGGAVGTGVVGSNATDGGLFIGSKTAVTAVTGNGNVSFSLPPNTSVAVVANAGWPLDLSSFSNNQNIGLYAIANTRDGRSATAGVFNGNVAVYGSLSKGGGSFKIDHPLEPETKYLYHSFVESPEMKNIYDGVVTLDNKGEATVQLPKWFEALNSDYRYQLTAIGTAAPGLYVAREVKGANFSIAGGKPGQKISWQVTGIRQDAWAKANRIPVEEAKAEKDKGYYLYPEAFGLGRDKSIDAAARTADANK